MINKQNLAQRNSIRLYTYDYSQEGLYFITICVKDKICLFGSVINEEMALNEVGKIAEECWLAIPEHFLHVRLHEFIIMPNHIHGIIEIGEVGANKHSPDILSEDEILFKSPSKTIGSIIRGFKIGVIKELKRANVYSPLQSSNTIWQRNYYEHIIRDDESYQKIAEYITENPRNWQTDDYYKEN